MNPSPAGIIALSTWLPLRHKLLEASGTLVSKASVLPVFVAHGSNDHLVSYDFGKRSAHFLKQEINLGEHRFENGKNRGVEFKTYSGMRHTACAEEVSLGGQLTDNETLLISFWFIPLIDWTHGAVAGENDSLMMSS